MKFLTFAFVINFILVCWPKLDITYVLSIVAKGYRLPFYKSTPSARVSVENSISTGTG